MPVDGADGAGGVTAPGSVSLRGGRRRRADTVLEQIRADGGAIKRVAARSAASWALPAVDLTDGTAERALGRRRGRWR